MTDYLRFLLTPTDRDRIDPDSIVVTETPFEPAPADAAASWPESLRIQFRISDPANGAPQLRMLFPGSMQYIPDIAIMPGVAPAMDEILLDPNGRVTSSQYDDWPNKGSLCINAIDRRVGSDLNKNNKIDGIGAAPTLSWFGPVEITADFLNETLLHGLEKVAVGPPASGGLILGADALWPLHALAGFYSSDFHPLLLHHIPPDGTPADRGLDDVARFDMPRLVMDTTTGQVDLTITLARKRTGREISDFPKANPHNVPTSHPGYPDFDIIPARLFMQQFRADLIGGDIGNAIVDAIIGFNVFFTNIKANLDTLGFGDLGPANTFDRRTKWAVREFQIYSKMTNVAAQIIGPALEHALGLNPIVNAMPYTGPVNGHLNADTRARIVFWLKPANSYRCPVVVTARIPTGEEDTNYQDVMVGADNIWEHDAVNVETVRMFVRDVSGYYALPATDGHDITVQGGRFIVIGYYETDGLGGPRMEAGSHSWQSMELDGQRLTGIDETTMHNTPAHAAKWSTYLTVLPTVREEAALRFDVLNAYDSETMSVPLFHYSLKAGELGGLLSFMKHHQAVDFEKAIGFFGLKPEKIWPNTKQLQAKHASDLQTIQGAGAAYEDISDVQEDMNYFKSWHWFYRFVMANRIFDTWKRTAYDFARQRLADMRATVMTGRPSGNTAVLPAGTHTIADVFTSEAAYAILLRWHVKDPGNICEGGTNPNAGDHLWNALLHAQTPANNGNINVSWTLVFNAWTDDHERALINGLVHEGDPLYATADKPTPLNDIRAFARDGQAISEDRGSLSFDPP